MLSRTADHLFWMARYTERAENTARMLDVNYQSALLPQSTEVATLGWQGLLSISELLGAYQYQHGAVTARAVLDFMGERPLGAAGIFAAPERWPERIIAMTLARVGGTSGPDLERLRQLRALAPDKRIYAAGCVRGADDLRALRSLGCAGVLVASALHDGRLGPDDLVGDA